VGSDVGVAERPDQEQPELRHAPAT
jgi:hypothetical protein